MKKKYNNKETLDETYEIDYDLFTVEEIIKIIKEKFDLTPNGIINYLNLREPIYSKTTNYGHFGKEELEWEKIINIKNN